METQSLLTSLSNAFGVSGFEDDVRRVIEGAVAPWADEVRTDVLGNLLVTRRGRAEGGPTVMLDAHMDEIGFLITHIEPDGFLRFTTVGGWDTRLLLAHAVTIRTRGGALVRGVVGSLPPHILSGEERERPVPLDALYLDIGAASAEEAAQRGIRIGDPATMAWTIFVHQKFLGLVPNAAGDLERTGRILILCGKDRLYQRRMIFRIA
ncbi:MAG TPA: hypothetical protein VKW09_08900 [bacterium]|nr:hypothetical protein [bacterium]